MKPTSAPRRPVPHTFPASAGDPSAPALSWRGRGALLLFAVHVTLLFLPPIPPVSKGSIWSHLLAVAVVILGGLEVHRLGPRLVAWWAGRTAGTRASLVAGALAWLLVFGIGMRILAPGLFGRWSGEEGVWEPLSVLLYITAAVAVLAAARSVAALSAATRAAPAHPAARQEGRHLRLVATGYVLLALEEVDYFGIIGGMVGRIDGVYAGSPHDLIRLWAQGALGVRATIVIIALGVALLGLLLASGYLQPRRIARMLLSPAALWLVPAAVLIGLAAVDDAGLWYLPGAGQSPEELLELGGALCLAAFGLEAAIRAMPPPEAASGVRAAEQRGSTLEPSRR
jgi:hypothetical protein